MTINMSIADRTIRTIIAITLLIINNKGIISGGIATTAIIISVFFLLTSAAGYCLLYSLFGIRTSKNVKYEQGEESGSTDGRTSSLRSELPVRKFLKA